MTNTTASNHSIVTRVAYVVVLITCGLLCWRAALPCNRDQGGRDFLAVTTDDRRSYLPRDIYSYENVVTQTVVHNFLKDGFSRTNLLPNRKGHPRVSMYDFTHTMCESLTPPTHVMKYWNLLAQPVDVVSANNDCIYTHYPPLGEWVFAVMAVLVFDHMLYFKIFAIVCNCGFLLVLYFWLRREVRESAALVATLLTATLPGFIEWADVLSYHSLQYLLLLSGIASWSVFLRRPRVSWFILTWALYYCESLASYQLTLFFGLSLLGLLILHPGAFGSRKCLILLAAQGSAPFIAWATHFAMSVGLFGLSRAWANLVKTLFARATERLPGGIALFMRCVNDQLMPWVVALLAVLIIVAVRIRQPGRLARPLGLLITFLVGGFSFMAALPGTTSWHAWMMYRHLMPFMILTIALAADAVIDSAVMLRRNHAERASMKGVVPMVSLGALVIGLCLFGQVARRNTVNIVDDIKWNQEKGHTYDAHNLVQRSLDVFSWADGTPHFEGSQFAPLIGLQEHVSSSWVTDFRLFGPNASHYEVWWLDDVTINEVRLLVGQTQNQTVTDHCNVGFFDGQDFQRVPLEVRDSASNGAPNHGEQSASNPLAWVNFKPASGLHTKALRLTCQGHDQVALRQIQAF